MARDFAGYLGGLGMIVALLRGVMHGAGIDGTILQAVAGLASFAVVGAVIGAIAETVVDESVKTQLEKQLAEADSAAEVN